MRFINFINEASFSNPNLEKVIKLIKTSLSKRVGSNFYPFGGKGNNFEKFDKSSGIKGIGMIYVLDDGRLLRFNWESNKKSSTITSIDIWNDMKNIEIPDYNLDIPSDYNIVQSLNIIGDFIKRPVKREISEARTYSDKRYKDAEKYGIDVNLPTKEFNSLVGKAKTKEKKEFLTGKKGVKEKSTTSKATQKAEDELEAQKTADPKIIFNDLDDLITMVGNNVQKSLLITGMAGVGKTFTVVQKIKEILGPEGKKWIIMKGKSSPLGLYSTLFLHRDKLIVFDDMDSVFSNSDTVNMLKAALDSYDVRRISWVSPATINVSKLDKEQKEILFKDIEEKLMDISSDSKKDTIKYPSEFEFTGRIIFISNIHESKMDKAIKSRSFVIDITLKAKDIFKRMESILEKIEPDVPLNIKKEVLTFLREEKTPNGQITNMRTLINAIKCKQSGSPRWKHLAANYA